jgi:hypothetical protein
VEEKLENGDRCCLYCRRVHAVNVARQLVQRDGWDVRRHSRGLGGTETQKKLDSSSDRDVKAFREGIFCYRRADATQLHVLIADPSS